MSSTARLVAGVIAALFVLGARLYEMNAAFGVVIVCVALAATMEVMMATTVAMRMTPGRENFWIRIVIVFILFGFLLCWFSYVLVSPAYQMSVTLPVAVVPGGRKLRTRIVSALATRMSTLCAESMYTLWVCAVPLLPPVVVGAPKVNDSTPAQLMPPLGLCNKLT